MITGYIAKQQNLQKLCLLNNDICSDSVERILSTLNASTACTITLQEIHLKGCNFYNKKTCKELAEFLIQAPNLTFCVMDEQIGPRKIQVKMLIYPSRGSTVAEVFIYKQKSDSDVLLLHRKGDI